MSKTRNNFFLLFISFLKYSIILFILTSLPKVKSISEISFTVKCIRGNDDDDWPKIIADSFNDPSKIRINGVEPEKINYNWYDIKYGYSTIVLTYNRDIDSYENMFKGISNLLVEITLLNFNTQKPKSMKNMFYGTNFEKITFENIDTSAVTDMSHLFENCYQLKEIDISKFNTAAVTDMNSMFFHCQKLEKIDTRNFDTSKVTNMSHLFEECKILKEIDLSNFNTASVTDMNSTFRYCEKLKVIDARSFDTSKVTNMYDMFGYCYDLVYINLSSFNTQSVKVMQGIFIRCNNLKYLDISNFDYTTFLNACPAHDSNYDWCKFHYTFAYSGQLFCLNFKTFYFEDRVSDFTFEEHNNGMKFCVDEANIKATGFNWIKNSCDDQCFKDMAKKFDISKNAYVDVCESQKFDYTDLCWDDCPYNYYRIFNDRRTCSREKPGENFFLDSNNNIYYQCYSSCKTCNTRGTNANHNCQQCVDGFSFINTAQDKYAVTNNCYEDCNKIYYFNDNHEYFCVETCPTGFKLISEKNKCIDLCTNDDTYKNEYDNKCVKNCPEGTVNKNNICQPCYDSCKSCSAIGDENDHKCNICKDGFSKLINNNNCYENCEHYYYFDDRGKYKCLNEDKCPEDYKLINTKKKCIKYCKDDNIFNFKFEYNGGCYESCLKGDYKKDEQDICKCETNTTCKDCTLLAIQNKLCSTCNDGYYPIKEERNEQFMNCYDSSTIPSNYILISGQYYEKCYDSCKSCSAVGDKNDHKCNECKDDTYDTLNNNNNCYKICAHYYYFNDAGEYICLEQNECPQGYKLIDLTNKCIKNCKDDTIFDSKFEFNGVCYKNCPHGYYTVGEQNICKCKTNTVCKDCPSENNADNLCSTCNDGYYPKKEESSNDLKNCYNSVTIPSNYILISDQYERCYDSCKSCTAKGNENVHKCEECKDGYLDLNNDKNCYKECAHYYYFDNEGNYKCLTENKCPHGYKLIHGTKKCIDYCYNDNIFNFKFEFNGICYESCPHGYYTEGEQNICKCMDNSACKDCPPENNANNLCSTCNDGYYPKKEESTFTLKNCYNSETIPSNYIFKEDISQYESCYESCLTCDEIGREENHLCTDCKPGYNKIETNCNQHCSNYFYFEDDSLKCADECPNNYKLIDSTKKCIKNCNDENLYEYNNICYSICPNGHYIKDEIETCKCMTNIACKECPFTDNENTLCNSCNNDEGYYRKEGEQSIEGLINCYNSDTIPKNYFLNQVEAQYELCYETCGSCDEKGDSSDHKCNECKDNNYEKLNNNNNCYEKCAHYYYFDNEGNYNCLNEDKCPHGYKLIYGTNKCIDNCYNDNIFNSKFEFNGICYESCPNGYYREGEQNICKCMDNIACKDCPSENNANNLCSTCNIDKNYYPKEEDIQDTTKELINCYNIATIPSNYILISGQYKKCYESCKTCEQIGTSDEDHKCKDCKEGYIKLNNNNNCYEQCTHYYYFDDDGIYNCQTKDECPEGYKLIYETNKCVKNCKDVEKYEYNNICYSNCPQYWTDTYNDHICKLDCSTFNLFFNYEKTDCISEVPKGYYIENNDKKFIGKCHENCEECEVGPSENNNNCIKCPNTGMIYYDLGNCRENCINGNYLDENSVKKCKCSNNISCKICNENGKCLSCNNELGYYQIEDDLNENNEDSHFINCVKDPEGYYLSNGLYKKCHAKCKSCSDAGENKCTECKLQYEFRNDFSNDKTCYEKCPYNYYYDSNNDNICTLEPTCPNDMKLIESKKRCIDICKNDNRYKFEYNGKCFQRCPVNTRNSLEDNNICEEGVEGDNTEEEKECNLKINEFDLFNDTLTVDNLNSFTTNYASKYGNSDNYITKLENDYFKIFIYNNIVCLKKVSQDAKLVDFGNNYLSLLGNLHLSEPIVTIVTDKKSNESSYALAHPTTGEILNNLNNALRNTEIIELEDIYSLLSNIDEKRREYIIYMLKQEKIDLFDPSNDFYTNLCFYYDSPNNKDIPMKDRPYFFANINKCESRCTYQGIDYALAKFKCECTFQTYSNDNTQGSPSTGGQSYNKYPKKKSSTNIEVFKCMKDVFKSKYFKNCAGGIIMLILSAGQIACMTLYLLRFSSKIKKHVFSLFHTFKKFPKNNMKNEANPPKKSISNKFNSNKEVVSSNLNLKKDIILVNAINKKTEKTNSINKEDNKLSFRVKDMNDNEENKINKITTEDKFEKLDGPGFNETIDIIENEEIYMEKLKEYLNPEFDENDFDDVLINDKRTFLQFFTEKAFNNQIFIKTFYIKHIFKPLPLKIMLLILFIELYFVVSALFYSENYLSERFLSDEKEAFLSFVSKRIDEIIFTMIICGLIQYFCSYIFDIDDHLKRIFTNKIKIELDLALTEFTKKLKRNFIILIVISIVVTIFSFFYISSFNVVYPYIKGEWITCSVLILILMQIVNLLSTLLGTCSRYLAIKWNNVKLFRLSLNLD